MTTNHALKIVGAGEYFAALAQKLPKQLSSIMNPLTRKPASELIRSFSLTRAIVFCMAATLLIFFSFTSAVHGQTTISDDFNDGNDIGWTSYEGSPGTREVQFPTDPETGLPGMYRVIQHGAQDMNGVFTRGGSYRADSTYVLDDFYHAMDLRNFNDAGMIGVSGTFIGGKLASVGPLQTTGYIFGFLGGGQNSPMGLVGFIEFQQEVVSVTTPDINTGGAALTGKLAPTGGYRIVFKGGPGGRLIGEMYDRTDLLEPFARAVARDDVNGAVHQNGFGAIVNIQVENVDVWGTADSTVDDYYSSSDTNTPSGFPNTPQVLNLVPKPQTMSYTIPTTNQITFTATTLGTNQIATNATSFPFLKLFLNDADVTTGLSFTEVVTISLLGSQKTNFTVRWNGTLTSNTVYHGKIILVNPAGKGTTNNWYFDTFGAAGTVNIEAEDFNYGSGLFKDNPPVSGLDPDGTEIGGGLGYYNVEGTPGIDYEDLTLQTIGQGIDIVERNQYRNTDFPGTVQGRMNRDYDVRSQYITANVGEYVVGFLTAGDWMNYTRTFPSASYNVYLRASSTKAQAVRFDAVTGDRTMSNQTTVIRGQFLVPNTGGSSRFRYVPLTDAAGNVQTLTLSGTNTFRLTDLESSQRNSLDVSDLYLNNFLFVPVLAPGTLRPFIAHASPAGGTALFDPEGTVQITILNRDTTVTTGSIELRFDGSNVTSGATITGTGTGATISYNPPGFLMPDTEHTLSVVFNDSGSVTQSNYWSFKVLHMSVLLPSHQEAPGIGADGAFAIKMHKAQEEDLQGPIGQAGLSSFEDGLTRAERQVAGTLGDADNPGTYYTNQAGTVHDRFAASFTETANINYQQADGGSAGFFNAGNGFPDRTFPGLGTNNVVAYNAGDPNHFAWTATIRLQLNAGIYRMGWHCDDQVALSVGPWATNCLYTNAYSIILGNSHDQPADRTDDANGRAQFDFAVQTNGVYKFRLIQEEGGGGAEAEWFWVNRTNGVRTLVSPPIELYSSTTVNGPFTNEVSAVINKVAKTATVAASGNVHFYRMNPLGALSITKVALSGGNVVMSYEPVSP